MRYDQMGTIIENLFDTPEAISGSLRVPWFVPSKLPGGPTLEYRTRYVTLPSGAHAQVFSPGTGEIDDFTLDAHSPCNDYDQDVLFWIRGTHGAAYESVPMSWV